MNIVARAAATTSAAKAAATDMAKEMAKVAAMGAERVAGMRASGVSTPRLPLAVWTVHPSSHCKSGISLTEHLELDRCDTSDSFKTASVASSSYAPWPYQRNPAAFALNHFS